MDPQPGSTDPQLQYAAQGYPQSDPQQGYTDPAQAGNPETAAPPDGEAPGATDPSLDPNAGTGPVTDTEIDAALDGYGSWEEDPDYGRVWSPNATLVGADFTPYESYGSWISTDYGWSFNCDYGWGWLPFHYGRWTWLSSGRWGWVRGYQWGPAWVEWRHGGGYVGWRPLGPDVHVRDHRYAGGDVHWRFAADGDFARPHIRSHLFNNPAEGLRVTSPVSHPGIRPSTPPVHVSTIMRPRLANPQFTQGRTTVGTAPPVRSSVQSSTYRPATQTYSTYRPPAQNYPSYRQPSYGYRQPAQSYPTYRAPMQRSSWSQPARSSWSPPARSSWSAPARSSWSAPSHSSGGHSFGGGGGGHSSGGSHSSGGGHSGGGGHHR
jgi:uncharacterized membrane protein YgcG